MMPAARTDSASAPAPAPGAPVARSTFSQVPIWRKLTAGVLGILACIALFQTAPREWWIISLPLGLLVISAATVHLPKLGPQLLSRAIWWSNLALGVVLSVLGGRNEGSSGLVMAIACGLALFVIGRKGLAEATESEGYAPAAFRSSLLLLMIFALADAQTFLLFGFVTLYEKGESGVAGVVMTLAGFGYVTGFLGLYRLKIWGAIVSAATSVVTFAILVLRPFTIQRDLDTFLAIVALAHCIVVAPMLVAVLRKKPLPSLSSRGRVIGANAVIAALVLVSVVAYLTRR